MARACPDKKVKKSLRRTDTAEEEDEEPSFRSVAVVVEGKV